MPAAADHRENGAEDAGEEAAIGEKEVEVLVNVRLAAADAPESGVDGAEDDDVGDGDGEKEEGRDEGADDSANVAVVVDVFL